MENEEKKTFNNHVERNKREEQRIKSRNGKEKEEEDEIEWEEEEKKNENLNKMWIN